MITLYQGPAVWGLPNMSPFCIKVETYLRMVGLPFTTKSVDPRRAPKGKIPFIDDEGEVIADSSFIIEHLKEKYGDKLDAELSDERRAVGHSVRRMLEEGTYWVGVYTRWLDVNGWRKIEAVMRPLLPRGVAPLLLRMIRAGVRRDCRAQGTCRHARDEIYALGRADLAAVAAVLGDNDYLLGSEPTSFDATIFAFLISLLWAPFDDPLRAYGRTAPALQAYCERMHARYFEKSDAKGTSR